MARKEILTSNWSINPNDRAWFITSNGKLLSGLTHHSILKTTYNDDWNKLLQSGEEDWIISKTFEERLLKTGSVKIGEFEDKFYIDVLKYDNGEKDMIQRFAKSIITVRNDIGNQSVTILQLSNNERIRCIVSDLSKGYLHG